MSQAAPRYPILVAPPPALIAVQGTDDGAEPADQPVADCPGVSCRERLVAPASVVDRSQPGAAVRARGSGQLGTAYRFRCGSRHRQHRRIEIEEHQTLGHLDVALRQAFRLPLTNGISSFELVCSPQGQIDGATLDLGTIDPYDGEGSSERTIADLRLEPGACLIYRCELLVQVEHEIALETVDVPNPKVCYPRVVDGNPAT